MNRIFLRRYRRAQPIFLIALIAMTLLGSALLAACRGPAAQFAPPPPPVTVSQPLEHQVVRWDEYNGYLSSPQTAVVDARVSGLIEQAPFREGAMVHAGDLLFKIDPRPFQDDVDNKKAAVDEARATADRTRADYHRYVELLQAHVVSQSDYDSSKAAYEEATGSLSAAEAALENSRLNLDWTEVRAPISGRISKMNVTVGNLVNGGSGQATTLTTIVSVDPIYCYITVPQSAALHYQELALQEKKEDVAGARVPCFLQLEGENGFAREGALDFIDNQVDVNTGTVQIRCVFDNPTTLLMPGLFTLTRIPASAPHQAILIPDAAVNADQNERYLLIVGADNVVQQRPVKLGSLFGTLRSITDGLKPGEWVIVDGMQSAMPGAKVIPHQAPIPAEAIAALDTVAGGSASAAIPSPGSATQADLQTGSVARP